MDDEEDDEPEADVVATDDVVFDMETQLVEDDSGRQSLFRKMLTLSSEVDWLVEVSLRINSLDSSSVFDCCKIDSVDFSRLCVTGSSFI